MSDLYGSKEWQNRTAARLMNEAYRRAGPGPYGKLWDDFYSAMFSAGEAMGYPIGVSSERISSASECQSLLGELCGVLNAEERLRFATGYGPGDPLERLVAYEKGSIPSTDSTKTEETMTTKPTTALDTIKTVSTEAAWRVGTLQLTKLAREGLLRIMAKHARGRTRSSTLAAFESFLDTDYGQALVAGSLSLLVQRLPMFSEAQRDKLAFELQVGAITTAGNRLIEDVASVVMEEFGPKLAQIVEMFPKEETGVRVDTATSTSADHETHARDMKTAQKVA